MTTLVGLIALQSRNEKKTFAFSADPTTIITEILSQYTVESQAQVKDTKIRFTPGKFPCTTVIARLDVLLNDGSMRNVDWEMEIENLSSHFHWAIPELQDLEIQYIGRSVGDIHDSNSPKRLGQKHDPRRDLMAKASQQCDIDVIALYLDFQASLHGNNEIVQIDMPKTNVIDLIEGALINHFKPPYNEECVEVFPKDRKKQAEARNLGIERSAIFLDTSSHATRVYTKFATPIYAHAVAHQFSRDGLATEDLNPDLNETPSDRRGPNQLVALEQNPEYIAGLYSYLTRPKSLLAQLGERVWSATAGRRKSADSESDVSLPSRKR